MFQETRPRQDDARTIGQPDYRGKLNLAPQELYEAIWAGRDLWWQMGLHAIGDGAIKLAVDVFDQVLCESPRADHRHYLNHFTVPPPEATLRTMAGRQLLIAPQPNFT